MHISALLAAAALQGAVLAAPSEARAATHKAVSMMAAGPMWTIRTMSRYINTEDTYVKWTFGVDDGTGAATQPCVLEVTGSPASHAPGGPVKCGVYTITSGYSSAFPIGFTVLSVINYDANLIVWPGYNDAEATNGTLVSPDRAYLPEKIHT